MRSLGGPKRIEMCHPFGMSQVVGIGHAASVESKCRYGMVDAEEDRFESLGGSSFRRR